MAGSTAKTTSPKQPPRMKRLGKTVIALAATALVEKAIQKAVEDPRVQRKAKALGRAVQQRARLAGKGISRVAKSASRHAPKVRRAASRRLRKLLRS